MTYAETTVGQTIDRLLSEHPGLDPSADSALDNLDQVHIGGADAVGLLIGSLALAEGDRVLDIGSGLGGPARQMARRTGNRVTGIDITPPTSTSSTPAYADAARDLPPRSTRGRLGGNTATGVDESASWRTHRDSDLRGCARLDHGS
jgi:SAM-dependent methyltransferase